MPTANVFYTKAQQNKELRKLALRLKPYLAKKLSCGDIELKEDEITVRLIKVDGIGMIGSVEIEITAFSFPERVKKQDKICLEVKGYIKKYHSALGEIKVWLILAELGHSWK